MSRWFRFYDEVVDDPKVQRLPAPLFKFWVNSMCLASKNGGDMPPLVDMSFKLRMSEKQVSDNLEKLVDAGLVDSVDGVSTPHNWSGRQYESDSAAERMRRHRANKKGNALRHPLRNSDVLETDSEQIQSRTEQKEDTSAVASRPPTVLGPVFIALPTNRFETQGEEVSIYEPFVEEMQKLYPAIDVPEQLRLMRAWLITNSEKRKTAKGMKRFINGWLGKSQDRNPRETIRGNGNGYRAKPPSSHDKFNAGVGLFLQSLGGDADESGEGEAGNDAGPARLPLLAS